MLIFGLMLMCVSDSLHGLWADHCLNLVKGIPLLSALMI